MTYFVPRRGFSKIQLLSTEAMFGKNGIWHARDQMELSTAVSHNTSALSELLRQPQLARGVKDKLNEAIGYANQGKPIPHHVATNLVPMLNSAAFRTAGSSTMKWSAWHARRGAKGAFDVKRAKPISVHNLPQADVYVEVGEDLFEPLRETTQKVTSAVVGALDEARRRYPTATVEELRTLAAKVAEEGIFEPSGRKGWMKVDYKLVRMPDGKTKAALIDVSSELLGAGFTDDVLSTYGLPKGLTASLANAFLKIHQDETNQVPKKVAIMVRDKQLANTFKEDIAALRSKIEKILKKRHGEDSEVAVQVVLQQQVENRAKGIRGASTRGIPFSGLKVQTLDGKSVSPDLIIRYGRFPLSSEADETLSQHGVKVLDRSEYVLAADKTINARVVNLLKLEPTGTVFVPRSLVSQHSIFDDISGQHVGFSSNEWEKELDAAMERAKVENWTGVVVKLPTKLAAGQSGQEEVTAHFVNPHSPLQVQALKNAITSIKLRGHSLPESEKNKAKLTFEELVVSSLPELGGKGVEIRTLAMPRFKVSRVQRIVSPT